MTKGSKEYRNTAITRLESLLATSTRESDLQRYLEENPWLLLNEVATPPAVISQLPLGADYRCDFAYFFWNSSGTYIKLIEIESPDIQIFTEKDEFTAQFHHAMQQIDDWLSWCKRNVEQMRFLYATFLSSQSLPYSNAILEPRALLIAGRRNEINNPRRNSRWQQKVRQLNPTADVRTVDGFLELIKSKLDLPISDVQTLSYKRIGFQGKTNH